MLKGEEGGYVLKGEDRGKRRSTCCRGRTRGGEGARVEGGGRGGGGVCVEGEDKGREEGYELKGEEEGYVLKGRTGREEGTVPVEVGG